MTVSLNKPLILRRGWPADIEVNQMHAYFGEWVVFRMALTDTEFCEIRMPLDTAIDLGAVTDDIDNDYEEMV